MLDAGRDDRQVDTPTRVCPHCSSVTETSGEFCPHCGGRFSGGRAGTSRRVKVMIGLICALLVLGGAGVAVAIKVHHDDQVAAQHRRALAAARARAAAAAARAAAARAAAARKRAARQLEIFDRQSLETQLQNSITKDATQKWNQGLLLSGPAQSTTCTPVSGGSSQNLSQSTGTYSCIAVYRTNSDGTQSGYDYAGTINFTTGDYTWQLGNGG
jgi:type II secretory pathway pseudopilin PulG